MMRQVNFVWFLLALFAAPVYAAETQAVMLIYRAQEPGVDPYISRVLVTPDYMRMDDGVADGDFLLFDRKARTVYSVVHDEGTVLDIPPRPVEIESPIPLARNDEQVAIGKDVPKVMGRTPQHHSLKVNGKVCYDVVTVPGVMKDVVAAMKEFRQVLAGEHATSLPFIPADMRDPCDLALNTFAPGWQLQFGLPIQEWDGHGKGQILVDYDPQFKADTSWFVLPEGYRHYTTDSVR